MAKLKQFEITTMILATFCSCVQPETEFTYFGNLGPEHWSKYFNQCSGKQQSPININDVDVVSRNFSKMIFHEFSKLPMHTSILNNGNTVLVKMSYDNGKPSIADGPLEGKGSYQFQQLHFHWGENNSLGSEDRINNVSYPMELHVVFRNSKYHSFEEAVRKDDGVAVLAAFYKVGNYTNAEYDKLTRSLEHILEPNTNVTLTKSLTLFSLLPNDLSQYYTYIGSLTTPPCSEDVVWIDYSNPIEISPEMIERFRYLKTFDGSPLTHNFRPVQPLNNRQVYRSVAERSEKQTQHYASNFAATVLPFLSLISISLALVTVLNLDDLAI